MVVVKAGASRLAQQVLAMVLSTPQCCTSPNPYRSPVGWVLNYLSPSRAGKQAQTA